MPTSETPTHTFFNYLATGSGANNSFDFLVIDSPAPELELPPAPEATAAAAFAKF